MSSKYSVELKEELVEHLADLAVELGLNNVSALVGAICEEKLYNLKGIAFEAPEEQGVSLTHGEQDPAEELGALVGSNFSHTQGLGPEETSHLASEDNNSRVDQLEGQIGQLNGKFDALMEMLGQSSLFQRGGGGR